MWHRLPKIEDCIGNKYNRLTVLAKDIDLSKTNGRPILFYRIKHQNNACQIYKEYN